jgi:transcriptional regulator with XRE-family HTH domain
VDKKELSKLSIGERILYMRNQRELSQSELAKKANLSPSAIFQIEKNVKSPTVDTLYKIGKALDCNPAIFFVTENLHVFDMKTLREKYTKKSELNDTIFRGITEVVEYAEKLGFCKRK